MREETEGVLVEKDVLVGKEEFLCIVKELVRKIVFSRLLVLGCRVVRLVVGEFGMGVIFRVDDMRGVVGGCVVREVDCVVVEREDKVEGKWVLGVNMGVGKGVVVVEVDIIGGWVEIWRVGVEDREDI